MASRWAAALVVAFFGAGACGGSSSETPFPQSADEVLPAMAAVRTRAAGSGSSEAELPPLPSARPAPTGRAPSPLTPQISVSATSTPTAPPGAPPGPPPTPY
ncbi:MAG TPA: hypothetical protein VFS43_09275 [Polyangiaceae bacterium]|nr:hypothetical protein [Polyangiaceae bacterium]